MIDSPKALSRMAASALAVVLATWVGTPVAHAAGLLTLLTIEESSAQSSWWVDRGPLSELERGLLATLRRAGAKVLDPDDGSKRPRISKLLRVHQVSARRATNIAGLFGADTVLVGRVKLAEVEGVPLAGIAAFEISVDSQLVDTEAATSVPVHFARRGYGISLELARRDAMQQTTTELTAQVAARLSARTPRVGIARAEPFLVLRGLWDLAALNSLRHQLEARPDVASVQVAWLAQGLVALDINPAKVEAVEWIDALADGLVDAPPPAMKLTRVDSPGQSELRVLVEVERTTAPR